MDLNGGTEELMMALRSIYNHDLYLLNEGASLLDDLKDNNFDLALIECE